MQTDYMSTPEETAKQPRAEAICWKIAKFRNSPVEQQQVFDALWSFWNFAHAFDDLVDGDVKLDAPEKKEMAWRALQQFVTNLLINPMVFNNAVALEALFTSAVNRQILADVLEGNGDSKELIRAVRCADLDIIVHFARIAGGRPAMEEVNKLMRYDEAQSDERKAD